MLTGVPFRPPAISSFIAKMKAFPQPAHPQGYYYPLEFSAAIPWRTRLASYLIALAIALGFHGLALYCYLQRPMEDSIHLPEPLPMIDLNLAEPPGQPRGEASLPDGGLVASGPPAASLPPAALPLKEPTRPEKQPKPQIKLKPLEPKPVTRRPSSRPAVLGVKREPTRVVPIANPEATGASESGASGTGTSGHGEYTGGVSGGVVGGRGSGSGGGGGGGAVTEVRYNANYLHNPKPIYPDIAKEREWEGRVLVRVQVTAEGTCDGVELHKSSGYEVLDKAALDAVRQWRFIPAKQGGVAVASKVTIPIDFRLENE